MFREDDWLEKEYATWFMTGPLCNIMCGIYKFELACFRNISIAHIIGREIGFL